jgi:PHAX RNA-binding domain
MAANFQLVKERKVRMTQPTDTRELVNTIAQQLGETQPGAIYQIRRIVQRLGADAALAFLQETQQIEAQGGQQLPDGSRRRTPGGVFFSLVKDRVSARDRAAIFFTPGQRPHPAQPATHPAPAPSPIEIGSIPNTTGEVRTVKITLIGRPGPTITKNDYIMTSMQTSKMPSLPKGLPAPPSTLTSYTVYIAPKQWTKVAEAIRDPEDALIIEGFPSYDPTLEGIAVYATNVTTKKLQQAQREAQAPQS